MRQSCRDTVVRNLANAALVLHNDGQRRLAKSILTCLFRLDHREASKMADLLDNLDQQIDHDPLEEEPLPF